MHSNLLRAALLAALSSLVLFLAACGGGDDSTSEDSVDLGPDPIEMTPTDAPFYTEVVVRPEGSLGDDLNAALTKLIGEDDPGAKIQESLNESLAEDTDFTYEDDIEPWLGFRAGIFVSGIQVDTMEPDAAVVLAVTDADAAQGFVDSAVEQDDTSTYTDENYEGVDYKLDDEGAAVGIDGDFLVLGTEQAFKDAVDAGSGESLADNTDATTALADAPDNSLFSLYVDSAAVVDLIKSSDEIPPEQLKQIDDQLSQFGDGPIEAWGSVTDSTFSLGGSAPASANTPAPSDLINGFPSGSWLAFASADVGKQIEDQIAQFEAAIQNSLPEGVSGAAAADPLGQIRKKLGLDPAKDFGWIGDAGGFFEGTSLLGLGGGLVLESNDDQAAQDALDKLQAALEKNPDVRQQAQIAPNSEGDGFTVQIPPITAEFALRDSKLVAGVGSENVDSILSPDETLDSSDRYTTASDALVEGATPTFFIDFPPLKELIESQGQATEDPDYQMAAPYFGALDYMIAGTATDGDRTSASVVLGVKDSEDTSGTDVAPAVITP